MGVGYISACQHELVMTTEEDLPIHLSPYPNDAATLYALLRALTQVGELVGIKGRVELAKKLLIYYLE
jgi:hypothetical protein